MIVRDILSHFLSLAPWVDPAHTWDRVVAGDPDADVDQCLVTWMPNMRALREALARGMHLVVCHEPTYWNSQDACDPNDPRSIAKKAFIDSNGLVILRNHDCWDKWPGIGIPWAWARFLELGDTPQSISTTGFQHRYDIAPVALSEFASRVARHCAPLGEGLVQVTGDGTQPVSRIGIGTGCYCDIPRYQDMGCDCSIVCDDGSCYWAGIQRAEDCSHPVIRVNHGTSEEPGMVTLTSYINATLPGLHAEHLPHGSTFRLVGERA